MKVIRSVMQTFKTNAISHGADLFYLLDMTEELVECLTNWPYIRSGRIWRPGTCKEQHASTQTLFHRGGVALKVSIKPYVWQVYAPSRTTLAYVDVTVKSIVFKNGSLVAYHSPPTDAGADPQETQ